MKKSTIYLFVLMSILLIACNNSDWILYRASADYFPLKNGLQWEYEQGGVFETVQVKGDTIVYGASCTHILRDFGSEFWIKDNSEIRKLELRKVNYGGTDYIIQQTWLLQYRLPFILGNQWTESFSDTVIVLGDTYRIQHNISRFIEEITDLSVNAGMFIQTYKIKFIENITINDSLEQNSGYEWFAPNVGLVKKISNGVTKQLTYYSFSN